MPDSFAEAVSSEPRIHQDVEAPDGTEATLVYRDADLETIFELDEGIEGHNAAAREILREYWVGEHAPDADAAGPDGVVEISIDDVPGQAWLNCVTEGFLRGLGIDPEDVQRAVEKLSDDEGNG